MRVKPLKFALRHANVVTNCVKVTSPIKPINERQFLVILLKQRALLPDTLKEFKYQLTIITST